MNAPEFEHINVAVDGPRGTLTLTQPQRLNPLSSQTLRDIADAARWFDRHGDLKVVVVSGEGRVFSAGADVRSFGVGGDAAESGLDANDDADSGRHMADAMEAMRAVTIAKLHGHVIGGGLVLAATCDLRLAADDTSFAIPEIDLGIPLAWGGIPRLVREIGPALTKELVMTCRPFGADEARSAGFLNRVVPVDELDAAVEALATELAEKPKLALLATKWHTNAVTEQMVGTGRAWGDSLALLAGLRDAEGRDSAERYLQRLRESKPR